VSKLRRIEEAEQRREQQLREQVEDERASTRAEYKEVADRFDTFVELCEDSWKDFIEALNEHEGTSHDDGSFNELVYADVLSILTRISSVTGGEVRCGRLYQVVFAQLRPDEYFTVAMCSALFHRVTPKPVKVPFVVKALGGFPEVYGANRTVTLGRYAALAFKSLVLAAFDGSPRSAQSDALKEQYLELLKPYIPEDNFRGSESSSSNRNGSERTAHSHSNCKECSEYYPVLRLKPDANKEEVKTAYRNYAQIYHPDKCNSNERVRKTAEGEMTQLNVAYEHIMTHFDG